MKSHFNYSDQEFERLFEKEQLDPSLFSHEAHLRLAYIHLEKYGEKQAIRNLTEQIWLYAEGLGVFDKYNETVTVASIKAVKHFMKKMQGNTFKSLIEEYPQLKNNFKELIFTHYSQNIFEMQSAREKYLEPDLIPFD